MVRVAINTGMRRAARLTWERVNLSTGTITLYTTKSGEPRAVPINGAVYATLVALAPDQARRTGPVFPRDADGHTWRDVRRPFIDACQRAGIVGVRWHDLRHTCASWLVMNGRTLYDVKEMLGHGDLRMSQKYAHLSAGYKLTIAAALDGLTAPMPMASRLASNTVREPATVANPASSLRSEVAPA
jgi:integrase